MLFNKPQSNPVPVNVIWIGASLTRYEFELYPIGTYFARLPGVYMFCKPALGSRLFAIYVGETDNFQRRLTTDLNFHHRLLQIRAAGATHICTLTVPGYSAIRKHIETDLRHALNPPCNRQ